MDGRQADSFLQSGLPAVQGTWEGRVLDLREKL